MGSHFVVLISMLFRAVWARSLAPVTSTDVCGNFLWIASIMVEIL
jgi:hypothetical protein